jgi:hypothetical protein
LTLTLAKQLDHLPAEVDQVVGLARGYQPAINVMRWPRTPSASISVNGPWQIAAIGAFACTRCLTNANRLRVGSQRVRICDATRQNERIKPFRRDACEVVINRNLLAFLTLDLSAPRRDNHDLIRPRLRV